MADRITSLNSTLEKLLEAEHFLVRAKDSDPEKFKFEFNAFLSASRSATFVMQKSLKKVYEFDNWYSVKQEHLRADAAARYFIELRNVSQKEGCVGVIFGSDIEGGWASRFAGNESPIPTELQDRDVLVCAREHLGKLAKLVDECWRHFPFEACPGNALTSAGLKHFGYSIHDIEAFLQFPKGWSDLVDFNENEKLFYLRREVQPFRSLELFRLLQQCRKNPAARVPQDKLLDELAAEARQPTFERNGPQSLFMGAILRRIERLT